MWLRLLGGLGALAILVEVIFRVLLRLRGIRFTPPKTHRDLYLEPHPYLPFVYKPNSVIRNIEAAPYPLHPGRFEVRPVHINNIRFFNEDVDLRKRPGTCRVMCLGNSSTANNLCEVGDPQEYSYPLCLRDSLRRRFGDGRFEVLNCGMGGWTSAEIFINFSLHLIDLRPDLVVLCHGLNDLDASLTAPFASDYSHSRRNLGGVFARIRVATYVPNLRWWKSYFYLKRALLGFGNIRYDLLRSIRVRRPDFDGPFMGLGTERRNVEHLIHLCQANQIRIILATYPYHVYAQVSRDRRVLKYQEGVRMENAMIRELADQHRLPLVDLASLIPDDDKYFVDTVHFTPEGCGLVADRLAERITEVFSSAGERMSQQQEAPR